MTIFCQCKYCEKFRFMVKHCGVPTGILSICHPIPDNLCPVGQSTFGLLAAYRTMSHIIFFDSKKCNKNFTVGFLLNADNHSTDNPA